MAVQRYDFSPLMNIEEGEILKGAILSLCQYAHKNPSETLYAKSSGGFQANQYITHAENCYLRPNQTSVVKVQANSGFVICGVIVYDTQNKMSEGDFKRMRVDISAFGKQTIDITLKAPEDKELQAFIIVTSKQEDGGCIIM